MTIKIKDFYADWCGPCDRQSEIMEDVEEEWSEDDDVAIEKIDIDENEDTAREFDVRSIPTIIISEEIDDDEEIVNRYIGVTQEDKISEAVRETLN